jgi:PBP1b-binding outer membrane lipoprotein LpoB
MITAALLSLGACTQVSPTINAAGTPTVTLDPNTRGPVAGVGIEGQDIMSMTDQMMRDMMGNPTLAGQARPPQIIVDGEFFSNESSQRINRNLIADRLRIGLNRNSQGRMIFVSRQSAAMVQQERDLKRQGLTDVGTKGLTQAQAGGDYRLRGNIASLDSRSRTGAIQRYNQITFEMVDLERGTIVWSGIYEFARAATDDVIYR